MVTSKYNYRINVRNDIETVLLVVDNNQLKNSELMMAYFYSDVTPGSNDIIREICKIDNVLSGKVDLYKGGGTATFLKGTKELVTIEEIFPEDEDNPKVCEIETIEFRKLLLIWAEEFTKYKWQIKKITEEEKEEMLGWIYRVKDKY